jgi:hypothetical protein
MPAARGFNERSFFTRPLHRATMNRAGLRELEIVARLF